MLMIVPFAGPFSDKDAGWSMKLMVFDRILQGLSVSFIQVVIAIRTVIDTSPSEQQWRVVTRRAVQRPFGSTTSSGEIVVVTYSIRDVTVAFCGALSSVLLSSAIDQYPIEASIERILVGLFSNGIDNGIYEGY